MYGRIILQWASMLFLFFLLGCENSNSDSTNNGSDDSDVVVSASPKFLQQNFPVLDSISQSKEKLNKLLNRYAYQLTNASKTVDSDKDLQTLFDMRAAQIIPTLHREVLDPIALNDGVFYHSSAGAKLDEELKKLGMQAIYSEGMYLDLGPSEMLTDEMEKYATEVFRWYMDFQSAKTTSMMGEYPFLNLDGEGEMVAVGEKMQEKYPDHELTQKIEEDFRMALKPLTDVHAIKSEFDKSYMVNDLATEFYPNATNIDALKKFTQDFPNSKYSKVVSNIIANMSEMEPKQNGWKDLYLAVVSWEDLAEQSFSNPEDSTQVTSMTCINAEKKAIDFLKKGIAIPHTLRLENKGEDKCALVYRFYADKAKAEAALKEIKKEVPDAVGVVQLTHNPLEKTWTVR